MLFRVGCEPVPSMRELRHDEKISRDSLPPMQCYRSADCNQAGVALAGVGNVACDIAALPANKKINRNCRVGYWTRHADDHDCALQHAQLCVDDNVLESGIGFWHGGTDCRNFQLFWSAQGT